MVNEGHRKKQNNIVYRSQTKKRALIPTKIPSPVPLD